MRMLAAIVVLASVVGCSSKTPSSCNAPKLVPAHLPAGVRPASDKALVPGAWTKTWKNATVTVQLVGDPQGNLGDVKSATVRGRPANYGPTGIDAGPLAVEWSEPGSCNGKRSEHPYVLIVRGVPESEMLKIANSLRS